MKKQFFSLLALVSIMLVGVTSANAQTAVDHTYVIPSGTTSIDQTLINTIAESAKTAANADSYSATITIPAGEYTIPSTINLPDGFSVNFIGADNARPKLTVAKSIGIGGSHEFVHFENVELVDGGCQYLINQSADATLGEFSVKNIHIYDFERSFIRTQGSGNITISNVIVDNSIFTNMSTGNGYAVFHLGTATTNIGKIELTNSVFNTSQNSFITASFVPIANGITITNCTFYNTVASPKYLIDANNQTTDINITNTILGKTYSDTGARGIRTNGTITIENCIRTSDCNYTSNNITELPAGTQSSEDIFKDPTNGDLTLTIDERIGAPSGYKHIDFVLTTEDTDLYSLYLDYDAAIPENVTAYTGSLSQDETSLTLNEITGVIPANTAVVVKTTTPKEYTFEEATSTDEVETITGNSLLGVLADTPVSTLEANSGKTVLTLGLLEGKIGFRKPAGTSILANRIYLPVTTTTDGAKSVSIVFGGETTGISDINASKAEADAPVYNLAGQRVAAGTKGLLIKNGKKYISK